MNDLLAVAQRDLVNARDNLIRARSAVAHHDPSKEWGRSGQTLAEIIQGYEDWERQALFNVAAAEALKVAK